MTHVDARSASDNAAPGSARGNQDRIILAAAEAAATTVDCHNCGARLRGRN
jgi:hypothetical protein